MAEPPHVLLHLTNKPENVLLVREMLSGVAQAIRLDPSDLNDIHTAVTEACNNVVLHAYEGEQGLLEVEVCVRSGQIDVTVRDHGIGLDDLLDQQDSLSVGIGLPVIDALTHDFQLGDVKGGGTEVRMEFLVASGGCPFEAPAENGFEVTTLVQPEAADAIAVSVVPPELARTVLPRLLSTVAAYAHFSTDQISDLQIVSDALVAHAPSYMNGSHLNVAVSAEPRNLQLKIGPLGLGGSQRLFGTSSLEGLGGIIEKLSDRHHVAIEDSYEVLTLGLAGRR
jgi:serine/threonine-protein kinase RsbW